MEYLTFWYFGQRIPNVRICFWISVSHFDLSPLAWSERDRETKWDKQQWAPHESEKKSDTSIHISTQNESPEYRLLTPLTPKK